MKQDHAPNGNTLNKILLFIVPILLIFVLALTLKLTSVLETNDKLKTSLLDSAMLAGYIDKIYVRKDWVSYEGEVFMQFIKNELKIISEEEISAYLEGKSSSYNNNFQHLRCREFNANIERIQILEFGEGVELK